MYPGLLGQKATHRMTNEDMADVVELSRTSYEQKMRSGRFTPRECKLFMKHFQKSFEYLFATDEELNTADKTA